MIRAAAVLILLFSCILTSRPANAQEEEPPRFVFLGDSISSGVWFLGGHNFPALIDIPWARKENRAFLGTSSTDLNAFEQKGVWPDSHPSQGTYWNYVEQFVLVDGDLPRTLHLMFGVNDAEGVNEVCPRITDRGPACPVTEAEYRGNLNIALEEIYRHYDEANEYRPLILLSSPTFAPRSFLGFYGPGNRRRMEGYEEQIYRLVEGGPQVCIGLNGREALPNSSFFRFLDWHPTKVGHERLAEQLANRIAALRLEEQATMSPQDFDQILNVTWIEENHPAWFNWEIWKEAHEKGRWQWWQAKRKWSREYREQGAKEWLVLCNGA